VYELVQSDMELSDFIRLLRDLRLSDIPLTFSPFSSLVEARHSLRSIPTLEACLKSFALKPDPKDEEPIDDYSPYIARAIEVGWNSNRTCPQCRKRAENPTHLTRKAMLELATDDEKLDKLFTELKETRSKFISVKRVLGR